MRLKALETKAYGRSVKMLYGPLSFYDSNLWLKVSRVLGS